MTEDEIYEKQAKEACERINMAAADLIVNIVAIKDRATQQEVVKYMTVSLRQGLEAAVEKVSLEVLGHTVKI